MNGIAGSPNSGLQENIPVTLMRGGTSKGVFIEERHLPPTGPDRDRVLLALMGSPDPMQIDGLGGTHSSTSKVVVVGTSDEPDIDVRYWFAQVGIDTSVVDAEGNCGNLTTAVAPYAIDQGIVQAHEPMTTLRLRNLNTGAVIESTVRVRNGQAEVLGDLIVSGVPGSGAPISTQFIDPAGGVLGKVCPTDAVIDTVTANGRDYAVSLFDITHPMAFVSADELNLDLRKVSTTAWNGNAALLAIMEELRGTCATALGAASHWKKAERESPTVPNLVLVQASEDDEADILAVALSMGKFHHALPVTAALCLAAAAATPGTVPHSIRPGEASGSLRIRHPKGVLPVTADVQTSSGLPIVHSVGVVRTARKLLQGTAFVLPTTIGKDKPAPRTAQA
ncbi:PrpF domain-containing protein [Pseudarthrobacter enclensis]|uniref:PrpF domain-containing protein n=1 Tax=Pseudarthrobacter enclensis TaxID=993070 RepID=UPI0034173F17